MKIPSTADWGEIDKNDLDAAWAFKQFSGKSFEEAEALFQSNALCYQEDLQSMPATAFNFYAPALVKYLLSERAAGDSDGTSSFLHTVIWILKTRRGIISPETEQLLVSASEQITSNQGFYDADTSICGDFSSLHAEILSLFGRRA
jgi:hypothetical protein